MGKAILRGFVAAAIATTTLAGAAGAGAKPQLVLAIGGEPEAGFDPLLGWGRYGHPLFQSTLLTRNADLETQADLATEWSLSDDRLTWTISLRSDVRFSDGSPLTADDVAFTFTEGAKAGGALDLTVLDRATAIDDHTVEIRLKEPWITFTENFHSLGIVPSDSYGPGYARDPVGSGPYRLVSWAEGEQLIVEANPSYYGEIPDFERITFLFTDEDTSLAAATAGAVDLVAAGATAADLVPEGFRQVVVPSVDNRGITFPMVPDRGETTEAGFPIGNDVTSDRAIRRAINLGIDRELLVDIALLGHGRPAFGPADGLPWSNPEATTDFDPDQAKALLEDAGWIEGPDGVRAKDGLRAAFPINYPSSDPTRQALAVTVAELLKPLGIEATATGASWDRIDRIRHSEPVMFGWGSHSPLEVYSLHASSLRGVDYFNVGFFSDATVDAHLAAAQGAATLEASYTDWRNAEWDGTTGFGRRARQPGPGSSISTTSISSANVSTSVRPRPSRMAMAGRSRR
jgi:peptide/nickel transport system substrate-binding protein